MKRITLIFLVIGIASCTQQKQSYLDASLDVETRAQLLLKEMTLEEKIGQLNLDYDVPASDLSKAITSDKLSDIKVEEDVAAYLLRQWEEDIIAGRIGVTRDIESREHANHLQKLAAQSRLKIPLFTVQNYGRGVGKDSTTIFPSYISMASSFNPKLVEKAAEIIARESRLEGINWIFGPTIDISRDARWGRVGETWGEDTLLSSEMGVAVVNGFQNNNALEYRAAACLKHYAAGGQSQNGLNFSPIDISERTLRTYHLPPFKKAIEAGAMTIMAGHNDYQGIPCHANKFLLTDILRDEYNFGGLVISDWLDIERLVTLHKVASDFKDASLISFKAGVNIHNHGKGYVEALLALVEEGKISESEINESCLKVLRLKFKLGLFENRYAPDPKGKNLVWNKEAQQLSLELSRQSLVLIKNENNILPLKDEKLNILVTGQNANNLAIMGDWVFDEQYTDVVKIKDGLINEAPKNSNVVFYDCGESVNITSSHIKNSVEKAKKSDIIVLALGGNHFRPGSIVNKTGGENKDVQDIELFGNQLELVKELKKTGKPIVVILVGGRPLAIEWLSKNVDAIIQAWEPGLFGGKAIAEVIYGKYNPSGKLPMSMPRSTGQANVWYNYHPSLYFRNFMFGEMGPLYNFGHGLSYTSFTYENLEFQKQINTSENLKVNVKVTNTGTMDGDEIVLCYINDKISSVVTPVKKLVGFKRISLKENESKIVEFEITPQDLSLWNVEMEEVLEKGDFDIMVGTLEGTFEVI